LLERQQHQQRNPDEAAIVRAHVIGLWLSFSTGTQYDVAQDSKKPGRYEKAMKEVSYEKAFLPQKHRVDSYIIINMRLRHLSAGRRMEWEGDHRPEPFS
jgi:hypothetical protein